MRKRFTAILFVIVMSLGLPRFAAAQGVVAHGSVAAAISDGETSPAYGGGAAWMFNRAFGLGIELSHLPSLTSDFPQIYCCGMGENKASATVFTTNVRLEIPTTSKKIIPFVMAGGGVAGVTQSYSVIYAQLATDVGLSSVLGGLGLNTIPIRPIPSDVKYTNTNMALTLGGGASFLVSQHVAIDADLRVLHIMGNDSRDVGRFGAGVSYRF